MKRVPMGVHATGEFTVYEALGIFCPPLPQLLRGGVKRSKCALRVRGGHVQESGGSPERGPQCCSRIPLHLRARRAGEFCLAVFLFLSCETPEDGFLCAPKASPRVCVHLPSSSHCPELSFSPGFFPSRMKMLLWSSFKTDDTLKAETTTVKAQEPGTGPAT